LEKLLDCPFCGGEAEMIVAKKFKQKPLWSTEAEQPDEYNCWVKCKECHTVCGAESYPTESEAAAVWNRRAEPESKPLTLDKLRKMETPQPLWLEEPPHGDMTESRIEPVLFNGICCGKEERACWVTNNAHRANARTDVILAGKINFYTRKPEGSENNGSIN